MASSQPSPQARPLWTVLAGTLLLLAACGGPPMDGMMGKPPPPEVGVASPIARELGVMRDLTGRIEALETVEIKPQVSGTITKVLVADGAEVTAGQALFSIDQAPFTATASRAEAGVAQAEAQLRQAVATRDRNRDLARQNLVSQQAVDDSVSQAEAAAAALAAARAALATARLDLGWTTVTAPIAGRIGTVLTTAGNLVQGGGPVPATVLTTLVSVDPVQVAFDLDEAAYRRLATRLQASAAGQAPVPVAVGLAGEDGHPHQGRITFIDNRIDAASGTIRLRAKLANPARVLTPGAYARIRLEVEPPRPVLLVHEQALQSQLATRYVLTVDDQGITAFRPVVPGPAHGELREIAGGLAAGDRVVVTNLAKVFFPGMPVQPQPVAMDTLAVPAEHPATAAAAR